MIRPYTRSCVFMYVRFTFAYQPTIEKLFNREGEIYAFWITKVVDKGRKRLIIATGCTMEV